MCRHLAGVASQQLLAPPSLPASTAFKSVHAGSGVPGGGAVVVVVAGVLEELEVMLEELEVVGAGVVEDDVEGAALVVEDVVGVGVVVDEDADDVVGSPVVVEDDDVAGAVDDDVFGQGAPPSLWPCDRETAAEVWT